MAPLCAPAELRTRMVEPESWGHSDFSFGHSNALFCLSPNFKSWRWRAGAGKAAVLVGSIGAVSDGVS
jgi:hypothetical protein